LETKGFDVLAEIKESAARRWVAAVNASGEYGSWDFAMVKKPELIRELLDRYPTSANSR
jgi:hypothetical protein